MRALQRALVAVTALASAAPALAEESIYVPLFTYRTGPFGGSGTPIADGMHDYLNMLNERDGGIGGVKLVVDECETGYDTKKGLECYDAVKPKAPVLVNPWSTGITLALIPKASVDKVPILSMAFGLLVVVCGVCRARTSSRPTRRTRRSPARALQPKDLRSREARWPAPRGRSRGSDTSDPEQPWSALP